MINFRLSEMEINGTPFTHDKGSILFMAPEVVLSKPVDLTCDIWSAGVIMYMLLFKRYLFKLKARPTLKVMGDAMRIQKGIEVSLYSLF